MKTFLLALVLGTGLLPFYATAAEATAAPKQACFKAHGQLMGKPALATIQRCWEVHGYKM